MSWYLIGVYLFHPGDTYVSDPHRSLAVCQKHAARINLEMPPDILTCQQFKPKKDNYASNEKKR
jgi:hypothetical protein